MNRRAIGTLGQLRRAAFVGGLLALSAAGAPERKIVLTGKDASGKAVEAPASGQVAVLVFLRPGQTLSQRDMADVRAELDKTEGVQIVGIVSGQGAAKAAGTLTAGAWPWPVVIDENSACVDKLEVHAWPTTLIVDAQGALKGRIAGWSSAYRTRLAAYVAFAAGQSTPEELQRQLAEIQVVEDSVDQKASRHLDLVGVLIKSGRTDDAIAQLKIVHALGPTGDKVRLQLVRADLLVGEAKEADELLAHMSTPGLPAGEVALLRGWAASAAGRWARAKTCLLEALKAGADPAETQYRLGQVYEHDGDPARAADAYRKAFECTAAGHAFAATTRPG